MRLRPRRLTFQLVSLFDLLIIVVFAQYFDLQERTRREMAEMESKLAARPGGAEMKGELERLRLESEENAAAAARKQLEMSEELRQSRGDLARLGALTAELFDLPSEGIEKLLRTRAPDEAERIRKSLAQLAQSRSAEAVRQILTLAELEKRCDIWQVHVTSENSFVLEAGDGKSKFRADSAERFAAELFKLYKGLPQPKSLVLLLISWDDASLQARKAAVDGVELAAERMRADTDRRSRFEYSVLGYIPRTDL